MMSHSKDVGSSDREIDIPLVAGDIIQYWFGFAYWKKRGLVAQTSTYWDDLWITRWFAKEKLGEEVDKYIRETWREEIDKVLNATDNDDYIDQWMKCPTGAVALIVLLDQFSRNAFRGTPKAWAGDAKALEICRRSIELGYHERLHPVVCAQLFMPLLHAENLELQHESVQRYESLYARHDSKTEIVLRRFKKLATNHYNVIALFGRYPERNYYLGRVSTPAEKAYLEA